ncbi:chemotaxis-specific protein-glutamate methyltransferase CheB [Paenibacillus barcinonensis]|uniref:Protein-glutamate methylesterase/protein-glutamine glutaminase n=1 Tax=Paenibacillus barcinonensis TaxID=198119 RepID=A0A2V4VEB2_PAEBA|nr:chemotaxis response regulator protein-glutamate methylesterase [Paenibacillus barcinonensis]PYE52180.1 two-component system chemotaxis response regulator CheB [Paenibacillus barcinonensis]QKS59685.1 chemotaxis-specific protein-glutamate methyltransferase CheB [Paenibacillus barcinonensis]
MAVYQVLVVDDSAFMRKIVTDLIEADSEFKVTATASNGKEAIQKSLELKPDIITMDVEMPEMNGLDALKTIMDTSFIPVIMLSGINEQGMKETIMALEAGAFDFIRKPSVVHDQDIAQVGKALVERMRAAMQEVKRKAERKEAIQKMDASRSSVVNAAQTSKKETPSRDVSEPLNKTASPAVPKIQPSLEARTDAVQAKKQTSAPLSPARPDRSLIREENPVKQNQPARKPTADKPKASPLQARKEAKSANAPRLTSDQPVAGKASVPAKEITKPNTVYKASTGMEGSFNKLVAIGSSTGGPRALKTLLEQLPADLPAPVIIVQHMPPNFTRSLAQRLNTFSPLHVVEAEDGMQLKKGTAYIAPGGFHLRVHKAGDGRFILKLSEDQQVNGHRPSVDTMFESLLPFTSLQRHLVLLTGMGSDGARMMKKLYETGVTSTFAENEETCVVYGMPRSAVELQCVRHLLPLQEIAPRLVQAVK